MREVNPNDTSRAMAFQKWIKAPMPMVTLLKTFNVSCLAGISRRSGLKFNMLMCWCIGKAASGIKEFYTLPVGERLIQYDHLAINVVVKTSNGSINTCDVPYSENILEFNKNYLRYTQQVYDMCKDYNAGDDYMVIGTSALTECEIDGAVNIYAGIYNNPFLVWGKYRRQWLRTMLPVSFQFHHSQMDGTHAAQFLNALQTEINLLKSTLKDI